MTSSQSKSKSTETVSGAAAGTAGVGAQKEHAESEVMSDIGQAEAWTANMKHRFDLTNENADALRQQTVTLREAGVAATNVLIQQGANAAANLMQASTQETIAKMGASTDATHKTTRSSLFEIDKLENIDEINNLATILISKIAEEVLNTKE